MGSERKYSHGRDFQSACSFDLLTAEAIMAINKLLLTIIRLESLPFLFLYFLDSTGNKVDINFAINCFVTIRWKDKNGQQYVMF